MIKIESMLNDVQKEYARPYLKLNDFISDESIVIDYYRGSTPGSLSNVMQYIAGINKEQQSYLRILVTSNNYMHTSRRSSENILPGLGQTRANLPRVVEFDDFVSIGNDTALYSKEYDMIYLPNDIQMINLTWEQRAKYIKELLEDIKQYRIMNLNEYVSMIRDSKVKNVSERLGVYVKGSLEETENELENALRNIRELRASMTRESRRRDNCIKKVKVYKENSESKEESLIRELNAILELENVKDIDMNNDEFVVKLNEMVSYVSNGHAILVPEITLNINMDTSVIRFTGDYDDMRQGFWRSLHPHVNSSGEACYGNIDATISELTSQQELLALTTILINYLQSVNADDPAGESYNAWTRVDPDTHEVIIVDSEICTNCHSELHGDYNTCDMCGDSICNDCSMYIDDGEGVVCGECYEDSTFYCELCQTSHSLDVESHCDQCGNSVCSDLTIETDNGFECADCTETRLREEREEQERTYETSNQEDDLMTCENCGTQGTASEILMRNDGIFRCYTCQEGENV